MPSHLRVLVAEDSITLQRLYETNFRREGLAANVSEVAGT